MTLCAINEKPPGRVFSPGIDRRSAVGQFSGRLKNVRVSLVRARSRWAGVPASAGGRGERPPYRPGLGAILGAIHLRTVVDTIGQGCTLDPF